MDAQHTTTASGQPIVVHVAPDQAAPRRSAGSRLLGCLLTAAMVLIVILILWGLLATLGGALGSGNRIAEEFHSLTRGGRDKIAIITVEGAILEGDGFVKKQIDRVREDETVKAVVLRVNSPGGTVTGSDFIYHHLHKLVEDRDIPLVVSMGGVAASGGYYVAMAVGDQPDAIFAEPTTWTGSIGVIIPHFNVAGLLEDWKIEADSIASGPLKSMGGFAHKMTEEERKVFEGLVSDAFERFKEVVRAGRPALAGNPEELAKATTGQVFSTNEALRLKLVDRVGFIEEAIDRALELAKLDREQTMVVKYKQPFKLFDLGLSAQGRAPSADLSQLLELSSPRAYYLSSSLPTLLTAHASAE